MPNNTIERFYNSSAIYSDCGHYRYFLSHTWNTTASVLMFIMLNPSKATERGGDSTVTRCENITEREEILERQRIVARGEILEREKIYGGFWVLNIFARWGTNPQVLRAPGDPIGPCNDAIIRSKLEMIRDSDKIVCAWGEHGTRNARCDEVKRILDATNLPLYHIGLNERIYPNLRVRRQPTHPAARHIRGVPAIQEWIE